jgi:hypothetical protein
MHILPISLFVLAVVSIVTYSILKRARRAEEAHVQTAEFTRLMCSIPELTKWGADDTGVFTSFDPSGEDSTTKRESSAPASAWPTAPTTLPPRFGNIQRGKRDEAATDRKKRIEEISRELSKVNTELFKQLPPKGKTPATAKSVTKADRLSYVRLGMQVAVSLIVLGGSLYIIISQSYDPKDKHWAYGAAGTILGFWLKN